MKWQPWQVVMMWLAVTAVQAAEVHRHGEGRLQLAQDADHIEVVLVIPAQDMIGFERPPRTSAEQQQLQAALATLGADNALAWPAEANCRVLAIEVENPFTGHADDHHHDHHGHADLRARYRYQCDQHNLPRYLDVLVLTQLPSVLLQAQAITDRGATGATLDRQRARLSLMPTL